MGGKSSKGGEDLTGVTVDTDIDIKNLRDEIQELFKFKILLLGTGESGKSTVLKQLKLMHNKKFTPKDLKQAADGIHQSIIDCMKSLLAARRTFATYELSEEDKRTEQEIDNWDGDSNSRINAEQGSRIKRLWQSEAIQKTYARRSEFWLLDTCGYYMQHIDRVCEDGWIPTEEDCLMARVRTTGIIMTDLEHKVEEKDLEKIVFQVVDVGGQRNERKKWIHCFDNVACVLFIDNLAGFNAVMFEDNSKNRMIESLELFNKITFMRQFEKTPIFLFLNKKDLFEKLIMEVPLSRTFPDYNGGANFNAAIEFISSNFKKQAPPLKPIEVECISAHYIREVRLAFDKVRKTLWDKNKDKLLQQRQGLNDQITARKAQIEAAQRGGCCSCGGGGGSSNQV